MQQTWVAVLTGLVALPSSRAVVLRGVEGERGNHLRGNSTPIVHHHESSCPGLQLPCSGHGECAETTGVCWCRLGWSSTDCSTEASKVYEIKKVNSPALEDMVGKYERVPMYLQENAGDPQNIKFIHYDAISGGWAISRLNSSCTDDICFFAYAKGQEVPPPKGYVFGQPDKHVYYKQLIFDDKELYPNREAGYHMSVAYTPDPNAVGISDVLNDFTGRYILQPRFVHKKSGKYAIMPVTLNAPNKIWLIIGLVGNGPGRRWNIIAQTQDPSMNRYTVPAGGWSPPEAGFEISTACYDHVSMDVCETLEDHCRGDSEDKFWVQSCCRDTCNACAVSPDKCNLPNTAKGAAMLLQRFNRTLRK